MDWIVIAALSGFGIGFSTASAALWPSRGWQKYRVCRTERKATEVMLRQVTPHRVRGRFARKVA